MLLTNTRSPSLSSLLFFFIESGSERLDTDSLDVTIRVSALLVLMPVAWAEQRHMFSYGDVRTGFKSALKLLNSTKRKATQVKNSYVKCSMNSLNLKMLNVTHMEKKLFLPLENKLYKPLLSQPCIMQMKQPTSCDTG